MSFNLATTLTETALTAPGAPVDRGLWVDVYPARQVAAAWLLIEMDLSAGLPGRFRFFHR